MRRFVSGASGAEGVAARAAPASRLDGRDGMFARGFLLGAAVATGALLLVPGVAVALSRAGRPAMKAAMRNGATAYAEFRRAGAEAVEHFEDLAAEVEAELETERGDGDGRG